MASDATNRLVDVWREVRGWPAKIRLELASQILRSFEPLTESAGPCNERGDALRDLIGIWKTDKPPSDDQVERIIEEERTRKYG
jgi:hypothetical protein